MAVAQQRCKSRAATTNHPTTFATKRSTKEKVQYLSKSKLSPHLLNKVIRGLWPRLPLYTPGPHEGRGLRPKLNHAAANSHISDITFDSPLPPPSPPPTPLPPLVNGRILYETFKTFLGGGFELSWRFKKQLTVHCTITSRESQFSRASRFASPS